MTSDLATMLRTSLHERANDVEPTPELWRQVDRRVSRRRALPLFVWTAAGVAAVVTAALVGPGLVDRIQDGLVIEPAHSPSEVESPSEAAPGPAAGAQLTHYVAVADGRLVLRSVDGSEEELWSGEAEVRTLAVQPGSSPDDVTVAFVTEAEGMYDLRLLRSSAAGTSSGVVSANLVLGVPSSEFAPPQPVWSPEGSEVAWLARNGGDGNPLLQIVDPSFALGDGTMQLAPYSYRLEGPVGPSAMRLEEWAETPDGHRIHFTAAGQLLELGIRRDEGVAGWLADDGGALREVGGDDYVVDVATHPDGRLYRLLAGEGAGSGDAEDAGLGLFLGDEPLGYPDLPTADPSGVWMTAVDGGVFVGLGSDVRQVLLGEDGATMTAVRGTSYAAWIPVAGDDPGPAPTPMATPTEEAPRADGPLGASGVTPYVAIDENGRVAVFTGDGGEREVILDEQLWAPEAAVRVMDVSVRSGSSVGEVSGVVLLATEGGPELAWFRAAAGETSTRRMEGPFGLGEGDTGQRDAPTFSPDGRHTAWVEPDGAGGWTLRTLGMTEAGPTDEDAGFGIDVRAERVHLANWHWSEVDEEAGTARGVIHLLDDAGRTYGVPIERQGDGALAVDVVLEEISAHPSEGTVVTLGLRGDEVVSLVRTDAGLVVRQPGGDVPVPPPFPADAEVWDLDLDVLEHVAVVTDRSSGWAYVVDRAGGVAPLEADAATTHGFDPVR